MTTNDQIQGLKYLLLLLKPNFYFYYCKNQFKHFWSKPVLRIILVWTETRLSIIFIDDV